MKLFAIALLVLCGCPAVYAAQSQAVACHDLKGATMEYGVPMKDAVSGTHLDRPTQFQYVPPYADGYSGTNINFLVDPAKQTVTVLWGLSAAHTKLNHEAVSVLHQKPPFKQSAPVTAGIVDFVPGAIIVAVQNDGWSVTTYSLFPQLQSVFITVTTFVPGKEPNSMVTTVRGACDFSTGG